MPIQSRDQSSCACCTTLRVYALLSQKTRESVTRQLQERMYALLRGGGAQGKGGGEEEEEERLYLQLETRGVFTIGIAQEGRLNQPSCAHSVFIPILSRARSFV